jgi:hypothetical protein
VWSNGSSNSSVAVTPEVNTVYYLSSVKDAFCRDSVKVNVRAIEDFNPFKDTTLICGKSIELSAVNDYSHYSWSTGDTTKNKLIESSGNYQLTVNDSNGCSAVDSTFINLLNAEILQNDTIILRGDSITLFIDTLSNRSAISPDQFLSSTLKNGLVAYYPLAGNAQDLSGKSNNGVLYGPSSIADANGISNNALLFDGVNDFIDFPNPFFDSKQISELTIRLKFKLNELKAQGLWGKCGSNFLKMVDWYLVGHILIIISILEVQLQ